MYARYVLNKRVFIAQLGEHCSANAEATSSIPVEDPKIFFSGYFRNCLNCDSLRWSHTHFTGYIVEECTAQFTREIIDSTPPGEINLPGEFFRIHQGPGRTKFHQGGQNNPPGRLSSGLDIIMRSQNIKPSTTKSPHQRFDILIVSLIFWWYHDILIWSWDLKISNLLLQSLHIKDLIFW